MSKLQDFISQVKTVGLARTNRFTVDIGVPVKLKSLYGNEPLKRMLLFCDTVQVPGVVLATAENRTFGEFRSVPYEKMFGEMPMSFYVDNDLTVKKFFDDWVGLIQSPTSRKFSYYDDYVTTITVRVEDLKDRSRYIIQVFEAYPKVVGALDLDVSNKDIMKMNVTMQYKYWRTSAMNIPAVDSYANLPQIETGERDQLVPESYLNDFRTYQDNWSRTTFESNVTEYGYPVKR